MPATLLPALTWAQEHPLDRLIEWLTTLAPHGHFFAYGFNIRASLALVLVSLCCGAVGSLVVGGRMAFFSDALAHGAFAGVSIGFLLFAFVLSGVRPAEEFWGWVTPVMVAFGLLMGWGIVAVRSRTGLSSDTVIGVFFAGAIGLAALLRNVFQNRRLFTLEDFLFGDPLLAGSNDLLALAGLTVLTAVVLGLIYNQLLFSSFNPSLALSRRIPVRLVHSLFLMLLAVLVNLCLRSVGALLINALLVVPGATAMNLARNMRQLFWLTVGLCLGVSVAGQWLSWEVYARSGSRLSLGVSGVIVLLAVGLFALSTLAEPLGRWLGRRPARAGG
jgi:zinc transport system permease protein